MTSQPSAMAGRACASISGLYVFGLLSQLIQPRETRNRCVFYLASSQRGANLINPSLAVRSQRLEARRATSVYDSPREMPARKSKFGGAGAKKKKKPARAAALGVDYGGVSKTIHLTSYVQRETDFESVSDGHRRPDDIESVGSSSSDEPLEGENDLALRSARKVGLGHSVWVESAGRSGPRQLSANLHWSPVVNSPSPAASTFEDDAASQNSQNQPLRAKGRIDRSADGASLSFRQPASLLRQAHRPAALAAERSSRGGRLSFIDSFPTGPTMTRSHGVL